jgi:hypothetical protein
MSQVRSQVSDNTCRWWVSPEQATANCLVHSKRGNRKLEVLGLDLSGNPTNQAQ